MAWTCLAGKEERDGEDRKVTGSRSALPQHLHILRGVPHLVLEATPAQASPQLPLLLGIVGGQLLGAQTHKHKCSGHSHCRLPAESEPPLEQPALFQGGWHRQSPPHLALHQKGPLRSSNKEPALTPALPVWEVPPGPGTSPCPLTSTPGLERADLPREPFPL